MFNFMKKNQPQLEKEPNECDHENKKEIGPREFRYLKKANYKKISGKFKKIFVIKNTRTGAVVELKGASSFHVCKMIGWKPTQVRLIEEKNVPDEIEKIEEEKSDSSDIQADMKQEEQVVSS